MKKIKVIDLLNMIANKKIIYKKVVYDNELYVYNERVPRYETKDDKWGLFSGYQIDKILNDYVYGLEEEKNER